MSGGLRAAELPRQSYLPMAQALQAAQAALKKCEAGGYRVSVAVVDRGGVVKALLRSDGAGVHTVDSSRKKAYTAASLRQPTQKLARLIADKPDLQALRDMNPEILVLGGGVPASVKGEVVGAIGVGGAPGARLDEACAKAGLQAIDALPKPE
ncbi:MAG: heme-binding protein [Pseudomonadota bacterium]